jgi:hypothetical protein
MATIGKLAVQITADTAGLSSGLANAGRQTDDFQNRLGGLTNKLKILGPAAIAAGGAFAVGMVKSVANSADELAKLSARTGVAVEDLSRLQYAANLSGVSSQSMTTSIERLSRSMADASTGSGKAAESFQQLGINVKNQDGTLKSQREVLEEIADRFAGMEDGARKSALAQDILGRSGTQLIPLLNGGAQGIRDMADESDRLGNTISTRTAKSAEEFNDNITRLTTVMGGLARTIAGPVIESLAKFTTAMFDAWKQGDSLIGMLERGFQRLGAAKDIEAAKQQVEKLEAEMAKMAQSPMFDESSHGAMRLAQQLDRARERLKELNKEQERTEELAKQQTERASQEGRALREAEIKAEREDAQKKIEIEQEKQDKLNETRLKGLTDRMELLRQSTLTEEELIREQQEKDMAALRDALNEKILTQQEYMLLEQDLELKHMEQIGNIRQRGMQRVNEITSQSWSEQMKNASEFIKGMTANAASGSRALFNINKAASIANALLSAKESVTNAYAFGSRIGGPFLGAAFAATAAAATASQIASLRSTSFNANASAAGSVSAGGAAPPSSLPAATLPNTSQGSGGSASSGQPVTILIQGETFGREAVRNLISEINEAISDGAVLRLA